MWYNFYHVSDFTRNCTTEKKVNPAHAKWVYQKEKEISVLVFIWIDLIQIEYWNGFTYRLMWSNLYHVSDFTQNCTTEKKVPPAHAKRVYVSIYHVPVPT